MIIYCIIIDICNRHQKKQYKEEDYIIFIYSFNYIIKLIYNSHFDNSYINITS